MAKGIKTGGRKPGTPNRTTKEIREIFQNIVENNLDQIQEDIEELEPMARLRVIIELSKFVLPTLRATDVSFNDKETIEISFRD